MRGPWTREQIADNLRARAKRLKEREEEQIKRGPIMMGNFKPIGSYFDMYYEEYMETVDMRVTWLMEITEVTENSFWACLYGPERDQYYTTPAEIVEIESSQLGYDKPLAPGMVFWWTIDPSDGSSIFRPHEMMSKTWTPEDIVKIRERAQELMNQMNRT